ncbi:DEAD/DEAH box helicase [Flavobacteriaceae bacterium Ap0902]|nr:DEAD/DEAH box helicase [Flavobacteriaceae bacterium Ap0902]
MGLKEINFPESLKYSYNSKNKPYEIYYEAFAESENIDFLLGYFSSNAIQSLIPSFCQFILKKGKLRFIINQFISKTDYSEIFVTSEISSKDEIINIFSDLQTFRNKMSKDRKFFFDCLRYLKNEKRLEFVIIKPRTKNISHFKESIFSDGVNEIHLNGSSNFTSNGLIGNAESVTVDRSWGSKNEIKRIEDSKIEFEKIYKNEDTNYEYLSINDFNIIDSCSEGKSLEDLIEDGIIVLSEMRKKDPQLNDKLKEYENIFRDKVEELESQPKFPFEKPYDYQNDAYLAWVKNNYNGVFAMATGTGKTITSLNCLLQLYNENNKYNAIILVPSITLLNQWKKEVKSFNFKNILKIGSGYNWEKDLANYSSNFSWGLKNDLIIISTYDSFILDRFQRLFQKIQEDFLLIADEAHNMGANNVRKTLKNIKVRKKIGLSATPKRIYDPEGTLAIDFFFNDSPPYTYNFGMEKALEFGFLTGYKYYPMIVELNEDEFEQYVEISKKLLMFFDFKKGEFKNDPIVKVLLRNRKRIIHKATNKLYAFNTIIKELIKNNDDKYVFAYIPEGNTINSEGETVKILNQYLLKTHQQYPKLKMNSYTNEDQNLGEILRGFEDGKIDILFAMRMLDEGVDIPRAEVGIFASSTGNPRQFIQRRGRLLRKHKDKNFATIYDMVVIPKLDYSHSELFNIERNLVRNELNRVGYFASLAMNFYDSREALEHVCLKYDLDLDTIINELK